MVNTSIKLGYMIRLAILAAIIILMTFTPLGYLKTPAIEITFLVIPVVIGAIILGPAAGAILGGVFGLTSFIQCFGASWFGAQLLAINPVFTAILCLIPRILFGWLAGLIFKALHKIDRTKIASYFIASLSGALFNTIFFVGGFVLLFGNTEFFIGLKGGMAFLSFIAAFVGINGLIEAAVTFVVGGAICKALNHIIPQKRLA